LKQYLISKAALEREPLFLTTKPTTVFHLLCILSYQFWLSQPHFLTLQPSDPEHDPDEDEEEWACKT